MKPLSWLIALAVASCAVAVAQVATPAPEKAASGPAALTNAELLDMAREVTPVVERLRGWKFKHPVKTEIYTEPQLRSYLEKKIFEEQLGPDKLPKNEAFLRTVGLIPADCDLRKTILDVLLSQVGGFYDPGTRAFYMLKREGVDYGPLLNRVMIAHELTHALDDQHLDLNRYISSKGLTEDASLALAGVIEGSATLLMSHYMVDVINSGTLSDEPNRLMENMQGVMQAEMARAKTLLEAPRYFSALLAGYLAGSAFLSHGQFEVMADASQGPLIGRRVKDALADLPQSSEQMLHPEKYWDRAKRDHPIVVDDKSVERWLAAPGRHVVYYDTVGELLCAVLTAPADEPLDMTAAVAAGYWTNDAAMGWGGDRFYLLAEGESAADAGKRLSGLRGVWITFWDSASDPEEFESDYRLRRPDDARQVRPLGTLGRVFYFGFSVDEANALHAKLDGAPLRFRRGSDDWKP